MQPKIAKEIAFLKKLRGRFDSLTQYKRAITDMYDEGLITEMAYKNIMALSKATDPSLSEDMRVVQVRRRTPTDNLCNTEPKVDPCRPAGRITDYCTNPVRSNC